MAVAAYAVSPIDPIPDFIPVLGYLDELVVLPLGIMLAIKLIPPGVMEEHRAAAIAVEGRPVSRVAAAVIIVLWSALGGSLAWAFWPANSNMRHYLPMEEARPLLGLPAAISRSPAGPAKA